MFKHILIATDGSELATKGLLHGLALAKELKSKATVVTVTEPWDPMTMAAMAESHVPNPIAEYEKGAATVAERILSAALKHAQQTGVACDTVHVKDQHPPEGIVSTAKSKGCDLIVMASHGRRGLQKLLLGSQAIRVLTYSPIPVLISK